MHEERTPTNLLSGRPWAGWGPPVDPGRLAPRAIRLIARRSHRAPAQIEEELLHSADRGRYLLLERLSVTGHAAVYVGVDRLLAREVAVKIHRNDRAHAAHAALLESQTMSRLEHPNVVKIYDMGEHGPVLYSVMELCDEDLRSWHVARGWEAITERILETASGLQHLHELGFAHGDLKPMNILIKGGAAKLADFGHAAKPGSYLPEVGATAGYVAPEVVTSGPSFEADVFALAATAWVCLFGQMPFALPSGDKPSPRRAIAAGVEGALKRELQSPASMPRDMPRALPGLLRWALEPTPKRRPTLEVFITKLQTIRDRQERRQQLWRRVPVALALSLLAVGLGFSLATLRQRRAQDLRPQFVTAAMSAAPLVRAEIAAHSGDGATAVEILYELYSRTTELSKPEMREAAKASEHIARVLARNGLRDDAELVDGLSQVLRRRSK